MSGSPRAGCEGVAPRVGGAVGTLMGASRGARVHAGLRGAGRGARGVVWRKAARLSGRVTANLPTNIVDFGGFDSSIILILRGGIPRPIVNFPEGLSQAMLVGVMLVGGLGVQKNMVGSS